MEKVLRKVSVKDRNPINKGVYIGGSCSYHNEKIYWHGYWDDHWQEDYGDVEYWYEEVSVDELEDYKLAVGNLQMIIEMLL